MTFHRLHKLSTLSLAIIVILITCSKSLANDLSDFSLEQLSEVKVFSASKKNEDPETSPSSVYVITQKDIEQMGATHIADALRTVPGLQVAKLSSSKWMVSSRGFGEQFSNKLLVLIDNRPLYSTMYSGVYWDQQDLVIDNIKQIEIIRGPGATLWGANAVNGVINIITKKAHETVGTHLTATYGNTYQGIIEGRVGTKIADNEHIRTSAKFRKHSSTDITDTNTSNNDSWHSGRVDFQYSKQLSHDNSISWFGELYKGSENITYNLPQLYSPFTLPIDTKETFKGATLSGNWQYGLNSKSDIHIDGYINYDERDFFVTTFNILTANANIQHDWKINNFHSFSWGAGYTLVDDKIQDTVYLNYTPDEQTNHFLSLFFQDTIKLLPEEEVLLTLGSKFEHNTYTNFEIQPSAKLSWQPNKNDLLWGSVSRAVRIPSRGTHHLSLQGLGTPNGYISRIGNEDFTSEELTAFEIGYKSTLSEKLTIDITAYYNDYGNLRTFEATTPFSNIALPLTIGNNGSADNYGFELSSQYYVNNNLHLWLGYSFINLNLDIDNNSIDNVFLNAEEKTPKHQVSFRTKYRIAPNVTLNNSLYFTDETSATNVNEHLKWDANIAAKITDNIKLNIVGENLLKKEHKEFSAPLYSNMSDIGRSVFAKITVDF